MARMMTAAMRPMTVLASVLGFDSVAPTVPPAATWMPAFTAGSAASSTACACLSVMAAALTFMSTGVYAMVFDLLCRYCAALP